ncbi:MAG: peptidylprolyl isomerase [Armatimonadota bacterium]
MKRTILFLLIALLAVMLFGCGEKAGGPPAVVATVDGQPISGNLYYQFLSMSFGRQALPALVDYQVMLNWAAKEKVPVTEAQVDKQIQLLKRDGNYDDMLASAGSDSAIRDRYRELQARINLGEKFNKFTDSELEELYNEPHVKLRYVHGARKRIVVLITSDKKNIQKAEKAIKEGKDFEAVATEFSDPQFAMNGPVKTFVDKEQSIEGLYDQAKKLKEGEISKPFKFTLGSMGEYEGIIKVVGEQPKLNLKFKEVKDEVKGLAALQKTMSPDFQEKFEKQKKKAKIEINLPQYKFMVDQIKNPQPMMGMPPGAGGP